jgi:hypothetical protein
MMLNVTAMLALEPFTYEELMEYLAARFPDKDMPNDACCREDNGEFPWRM